MKNRKKIAAFLMSLVMVVMVTGCSGGKSQAGNGETYAEQYVVSNWMQASVNRISIRDEVVYFSTYEETESADGEICCNNHLYSVHTDGSELKEIPLDLSKEDPLIMITSLMISADDTINIWLSSNDLFAGEQVNVLIRVDGNGKELMRKDLNQVLDGQYVNKALMTPQGYIIAMADHNVYILDEALEMVSEVAEENQLIGMAFTKDSQVICANENSDGKRLVQILDINKGEWGKPVQLKKGISFDEDALIDGFGHDFCYRNDKGIYGYDIESGETAFLMSYGKSNLVSEDIKGVISVGADTFWAILDPHDGTGTGIAMYTKPQDSAGCNKTTIIFGAFQFDENMKRAVQSFNKANQKYQITLMEYYEEAAGEMTADEAVERLNEDIAKGEVPDILDLNFLTERYAAKGLFEDLMPYIDQDEGLKEENFMDSVLEAMKQDGKLYFVSPDFGIATLIGKSEYVKEQSEQTMEDWIAICKNQQQDAMPFYADTKIDLLDILLQGSLADFCDWNSGECWFDSQEFKDILEFCNLAFLEENGLDSDLTKREMVRQGNILWVDESDFVPQEIKEYKELFGGELAYIGYPNWQGKGNYFEFSNKIGIYAKSDVKDGAWDFLHMLLSYEYQQQYTDLEKNMNGIPIRKDCFDLLMERLSETQEAVDDFEDGNEPLTAQEETAFRELVTNTRKAVFYDIAMMNIIEEETQLYFAGEKDLDEVVQMIQNRCTTYMNESK